LDITMAATELRSLNQAWNVQLEILATPAARRAMSSARQELPAFLLAGSLEPYRVVIANSVEQAALRGPVSAPLEFSLEVDAGTAVVAVARHSSGALTFHLPKTTASVPTSTRRRGRATATVIFQIADTGKEATSGPSADGRRGIIGKVIRVVVMKVARLALDAAVPRVIDELGKIWEKHAWRDRATGWKAVTEADFGTGDLQPSVPDFSASQPALLLLHGTFSHTVAAFQDLYKGGVLRELIAQYGGRVFGFDHFSVSASTDENASDLVSALGQKMAFDVVTHSRGGLVLRSIVENPDHASKFQLGRAVLVCSPNQGTPLATPNRWEQTLGWFANLLELFPDNPYVTAGELITECLSWLAQHIAGDLPGLASMDVDGDTVRNLEVSALPAGDWYSLGSDFRPDQNLAARLADMAVDEFFQGPNDLVVPTVGTWQLGKTQTGFIPARRIGCFGPIGNIRPTNGPVYHTNVFSDPAAQTFIRRALAGQDLNLPPISTEILSTGVRRAVAAGLPVAPPVSPQPMPAIEAAEAAGPARGELARVSGHGWDGEDPLHLIVLPPDASGGNRHEAQLLAIYGSARVFAPFRLTVGGDFERWQRITEFRKNINAFAEGSLETLELQQIRDGGADLFDALFQNGVRRLYDQARFLHSRRKLNVIFTSMIPWVADLPWEFAYDPGSQAFLSTGDVRFVRNVLTAVPAVTFPTVQRALKMLVVSAQPAGTVPLSEADEESLIRRAFRPLQDAGGIEIEVMPRATPAKFHARMRRSEEETVDIIHFIGHGQYVDADATGYLLFADDRNQPMPMSTSVLKDILRNRGVRLMFLNACETAKGGLADYNKGVAPGLVADGVPAVLANQYPVLDRAATAFSLHFYWCLTQGLSLGDAVKESRIALKYSGGDLISWAVPVLYARNPDAKLCERISASDLEVSAVTGITSPRGAVARAATASSAQRQIRIAVWDVTDSFAELDNTISTLNSVQQTFELFTINLNVPYGTWKVQKDRFDGTAYLAAERVAGQLRKVVTGVFADFVFFVTDRPLADQSTKNLYWWSDEASNYRINIVSTWGFEPPIREESFSCFLTNIFVDGLAQFLSQAPVDSSVKGSVFYYNADRERKYVVGRVSIPPADRKKLEQSLSADQLASLDAMLAAFHNDEPPLPLGGSNPRSPSPGDRPKRPRRRRAKK
jgi:hypothetical protein